MGTRLTAIAQEIRDSPIYWDFVRLLKEHGVSTIYDFHAHVSSGKSSYLAGASQADIDELPAHPTSPADIDAFYSSLFESDDIAVKVVIFDTALHAYDMASKNHNLLAQLATTRSSRFTPFAVITPAMKRHDIESYVEGGAKGFKVSPRTATAYYASRRRRVSNVDLDDILTPDLLGVANEVSLPILIHLPQSVSSTTISKALKQKLGLVTARYPDVRLILAHLGLCQTPSKMEYMLAWIRINRLESRVYLDVSAVTIASALELALASDARLLFGTDLDFSLVERARYVVTREVGGETFLADEAERGDTKTVLVGTNYGLRYRALVSQAGISTALPLFLFQLEAMTKAARRLGDAGRGERLRALFSTNAEAILGGSKGG